jgi:hypothetical protein
VAGRAAAPRALLVEGLEGPGKQQHWNVTECRVGLDRLADLVAALAGHHDVGHHEVRAQCARSLDRGIAVIDGHELHVLAREADPHHFLDGDTVVCEQKRLRHAFPRVDLWAAAIRVRSSAVRM